MQSSCRWQEKDRNLYKSGEKAITGFIDSHHVSRNGCIYWYSGLLSTDKIVNAIKAKSVRQYYAAASQLKARSRYTEALAAFKKALEFDQNNLAVCSELASTYVLAGKYKDAVALFEKVLKIRPDFALAYNNLAVAYYYLKQYDLAVKNCDQAIGLGYSVEPEFTNLLKPHKK